LNSKIREEKNEIKFKRNILSNYCAISEKIAEKENHKISKETKEGRKKHFRTHLKTQKRFL